MSDASSVLKSGDMVNGLLQEDGARRLLWSNRKKLEGLLPSHMSSERFLALEIGRASCRERVSSPV